MMKLRIYIVLLSLLASCNYLDIVPDNVATIDNAFTDKFNAEKYLFSCYSYLPKIGDINQNPALLGSDEVSKALYHENQRGVLLANGYQSIVNPLFNYWNGWNGGQPMYVGIRDCNTLIERIDEVSDMTEREKKTWKAEAKFIKAYLHFYLTRMYGPIHIIRDNISINESIENLKMSRDPLDECFNYVVELLDEAIADLPEFNENSTLEHGRITSTIAAAVKAKVLVTAASPLYNGESGFQIQNNDGTLLFPSDDAAVASQKWANALVACEEAIALAEQNGHRLLQIDDFDESGNVSDSTRQKVVLGYRVTKRDDNKEVVWSHTNSIVTGLQGDAMPQYFSQLDYHSNGNYGVPLKISLMYYTKNGVPVNEDTEWQNENLNQVIPADDDHRFHLKLGKRTVKRNFNREPRFYSDLIFDGALVYGHQRTFSNDKNQNLDYIDHLQGGYTTAGYAHKYCPFGYWPHKLVSIESGEAGQFWHYTGYAFPALRLADLYLLYAEALLESNQLDESKVWIDKVRERAGLKGVDEAWQAYSVNPDKPSTKEGLREILHRERLIEMAFEGSRFWDLRRWLEAEDYCNVPVQAWNPQESTPEKYYQPQTLYYPTFTTKNYFFPIAESEITKNPNLVQNYGW
ncbi:RagB/SusD family nutrient uptake outer membrane protein [Sunxiuqinia sp. sy24]|uniref:RagB/SusD family nutrient uptake outer membrane protein n=1 Tax=Sunxiuqinia sp. sy24 TaxID=3461495 RepID=UPI004045E9CE